MLVAHTSDVDRYEQVGHSRSGLLRLKRGEQLLIPVSSRRHGDIVTLADPTGTASPFLFLSPGPHTSGLIWQAHEKRMWCIYVVDIVGTLIHAKLRAPFF